MGRKRYYKKHHRGLLIGLCLLVVLGVAWTNNANFLSRAKVIFSSHPDQSTTLELANRKKFISKLAPDAQQLYQTYQVLPSITLAQAILESDWGRSTLSSQYHNLFGVKAGQNETGIYLNTQEYVNGKYETVSAKFKVYNSWRDSLTDHAKLLALGTDWNSQQYNEVISASNYIEAANGLQQDGYATDPTYTQKIISIVEKYHLNKYD